jgi:hypothetical protein
MVTLIISLKSNQSDVRGGGGGGGGQKKKCNTRPKQKQCTSFSVELETCK